MIHSRLYRHLDGENIGQFPAWMMRQAGRYLPRYRQIREKSSFWDMVTTPEIAVSITMLPLECLPVDALILFSDILTLPYGLGIPIELKESVGPVVINPLNRVEDFKVFEEFDPIRHTPFVPNALETIRGQLSPDIELIGFAGAPWTVACYLVEGKNSRHFTTLKGWAYEDPKSLTQALTLLSRATVRYLEAQIRAGARVVQLFDTWLSTAPVEFVNHFYLPIVREMVDAIKPSGAKMIYFAKDCGQLLPALCDLGVDVLGVDSSITLSQAEALTQGRVSLQGNLDPVVLLGKTPTVRRLTRELVSVARELRRPPILNLGHGILPQTPVENARAFIDEARSLWI